MKKFIYCWDNEKRPIYLHSQVYIRTYWCNKNGYCKIKLNKWLPKRKQYSFENYKNCLSVYVTLYDIDCHGWICYEYEECILLDTYNDIRKKHIHLGKIKSSNDFNKYIRQFASKYKISIKKSKSLVNSPIDIVKKSQ